MSFDAALRQADVILDDPLRSKTKSLFSELARVDQNLMTVEICEIHTCCWFVNEMPFNAGTGIEFGQLLQKATVHFDPDDSRDERFQVGDFVQIFNASRLCDPVKVIISHETIICPVPLLNRDKEWNVMHAFCGSFCGWHHAMNAIQRVDSNISIKQHVCLDADEATLQVWSHAFSAMYRRPPFHWESQHEGVGTRGFCTPVQDLLWIHEFSVGSNLFLTMSPPCVSWSPGGTGSGLASIHGWSFLDATKVIAVLQPICVSAECSDSIAKHKHYPLLETAMMILGYKLVWSQVLDLAQTVHMHRSRWLATWFRSDVHAIPVPPTLSIRKPNIPMWTSALFSFDEPARLLSQLRLTDSMRQVYGDYKLLPLAKRKEFAEQPTEHQVLMKRLPSLAEPLPTLCSNYSQQHMLDRAHLESRGIFASLDYAEGDFAFHSPIKYVALLGAIQETSIPVKIDAAFHGLGNAIATHHAALASLVGFATVMDHHIPLTPTVAKIADMTITARSHAVIQKGDFFCFVPRDKVAGPVQPMPFSDHNPDSIAVSITTNHKTYVTYPPPSTKFTQYLQTTLGIPKHLAKYIKVTDLNDDYKDGETDHQCLSKHLQELDGTWDISFQDYSVATIKFFEVTSPMKKKAHLDHMTCSPTIPFTIEDHPTTPTVEETDQEDKNLHYIFDIFRKHHIEPFINNLPTIRPDTSTSDMVHLVWTAVPITITVTIPRPTTQIIQRTVYTTVSPNQFRVSPIINPKHFVHTKGHTIILHHELNHDTAKITIICEDKATPNQLHTLLAPQGTTIQQLAAIATNMYITHHNAKAHVNPETKLHNYDVLSFQQRATPPIACGGHPGLVHERIATLPFPASLQQRLNFAAQTSGWLATDEMSFALTYITASTTGLTTTGIARWDGNTRYLAFDNAQHPTFLPETITLIPLLINAHWAALEVRKASNTITLTTLGLPSQYGQAIRDIIANYNSTDPHFINIETLASDNIATMCGWTILHRWFSQHTINGPDIHDPHLIGTEEHIREQITEVIQYSNAAWHRAEAPDDLIHFAQTFRQAFLHQLTLQHTTSRPLLITIPTIAVGVPSECYQLTEHPTNQLNTSVNTHNQYIQNRFEAITVQPLWLASDELEIMLEVARFHSPELYIMPPMVWDDPSQTFQPIRQQPTFETAFHQVVAFVIIDQHWVMLSAVKTDHRTIITLFHNNTAEPRVQPVRTYMAQLLLVDPQHTTFVNQHIYQPRHQCGWVLLRHFLQTIGMTIPPVTAAQIHALSHHPQAKRALAVMADTDRLWNQIPHDPAIRSLADTTRINLFLRIASKQADFPYFAAGTMDTDEADPSAQPAQKGQPDPLWMNDPWSGPAASKGKNTKWEDLTLTPPSPFVDAAGKPIQQRHRHQITKSQGGVILATRSHIQDLSALQPTTPTVLVLPQVDVAMYGDLSSKVQGPYEIILHDPQKNSTFKRIIQMIVLKDKVSFKLPKSITTLDVKAVNEMVVEVDSRVSTKEAIIDFKEHPLLSFKKQLINISSAEAITNSSLYGFRVTNHSRDAAGKQTQLQCLMKIPATSRQLILEASGRDKIFIRDFAQEGGQPSDVTVLPKFWETSAQGHQQAMVATRGLPGFAGLTLTKRGIAVRVWAKQIADARLTLLPEDSRLCDENRAVIPRFQYNTAGWPVGAQALDVVKAILQATKLPAVPLRTYRQAGVHNWVVSFEKQPVEASFTITVNQREFQILIHPAEENTPKPKGKGKGKGKREQKENAAPRDLNTSHLKIDRPSLCTPEQDRIERLESKVAGLETKFTQVEAKQEKLEAKIDGRFDVVQDQLRQLLNQTQMRPRETTGETPPNKHQRHANQL